MLTFKKIIIKSTQISIILTLLNVIFSLVLSKVYSGDLETNQITGNLGNITLLESMLLFLYGGILGWNTIRTRDSKEAKDLIVTRIPCGRGRWWVALISKRRIVFNEGDGSTVGRAFIFILCGMILLAEIVTLALLTR